ncbi:hypothetical protein C7E25_23165, partial [Stenotrophomonas maltophilia]
HAQPLPGPTLNPDQAEAVAAINAAEGFQPFLLDGVTGSGKTESTCQAIIHCLAQGRHAQPLPGPTLNPDQAEAVAAINAAEGFQPFLL